MMRGEEEADAEVGELRCRHLACTCKVEPERLECIGGARRRRSGPVSVLCDRYLARRHDNRDTGRDVQRVVTIAPGAADVDRASGGIDRDHPIAHRLRRGGDFDHCFAAVGQRREEGRHLFVTAAAIEHRLERMRCLLGIEKRARVGEGAEAAHAARRSATGNPAIRRKLASIAWPCSVAMLSGWNWTPWIGNSTWRKPMTAPSSLVALIARTGGIWTTSRL